MTTITPPRAVVADFDQMNAAQHRTESIRLMALAMAHQGHTWHHQSLVGRAQWHATMALVQTGGTVR